MNLLIGEPPSRGLLYEDDHEESSNASTGGAKTSDSGGGAGEEVSGHGAAKDEVEDSLDDIISGTVQFNCASALRAHPERMED